MDKTVLLPGEVTDILVSLAIGDKSGRVVHETEVVTDTQIPGELVLRTLAEAYPPLWVEAESGSIDTVLLGSKDARRAELRILACGTDSDPPIDLDRVRLSSSLKAEWTGPKQPTSDENGLKVESRPFHVTVEPVGPTGEKTAEVLFSDGEAVLFRYVVNWKVAAVLTPSPAMVVFRPGGRGSRILIRSGDRTPFHVKQVECKAPGVRGRAANTGAAVIQTIEIDGAPKPGNGRAVVRVVTDHPSQTEVLIPFIVLD